MIPTEHRTEHTHGWYICYFFSCAPKNPHKSNSWSVLYIFHQGVFYFPERSPSSVWSSGCRRTICRRLFADYLKGTVQDVWEHTLLFMNFCFFLLICLCTKKLTSPRLKKKHQKLYIGNYDYLLNAFKSITSHHCAAYPEKKTAFLIFNKTICVSTLTNQHFVMAASAGGATAAYTALLYFSVKQERCS